MLDMAPTLGFHLVVLVIIANLGCPKNVSPKSPSVDGEKKHKFYQVFMVNIPIFMKFWRWKSRCVMGRAVWCLNLNKNDGWIPTENTKINMFVSQITIVHG